MYHKVFHDDTRTDNFSTRRDISIFFEDFSQCSSRTETKIAVRAMKKSRMSAHITHSFLMSHFLKDFIICFCGLPKLTRCLQHDLKGTTFISEHQKPVRNATVTSQNSHEDNY